MAVNAVDALTTNPAQATNGFGDLSSEQFMKIMFTELANQDPLEPNDSQAMLDQLSSIRSIESDMQLSERLNQMVDRSDFSAASNMIGSVISGITIDAKQTIDTVFSVSQTDSGPILNLLGGERVRLADVIEVAGPRPAEGASTDD